MSELQESQRPISAGAKTGAGPAPKPNPSVNANPAAVKGTEQGISGVNTVTKPVSNPTQAVSAQPYTPVFTTDKIQHTKATRPKEYFDEQNRKNAEKKKQDNKNRKMILIIGAAIVGVLVLIGIIWLVVIKMTPVNEPAGKVPIPVMTDGSNEEISEVQNYLQDIYDNDGKATTSNAQMRLDTADEAFAGLVEKQKDSTYLSQINLAKLLFYANNGFSEAIISNKDSVNPEVLSLDQKASYYNILASAYRSIGDIEQADRYLRMTSEILYELNGPVEDPDAEE